MSSKPNLLDKKYPLRLSDFDKNNRLLPSSILDLFQDAAGAHATLLGKSGPELAKINQCWMLTRIRYEVIRQPALYEEVTVRTWPVESRRIELDRDYQILGGDGEVLIKGTSQWVVMDISDREAPKLVPARDFELGVENYIQERTFERAFPRAVYTAVESDEPYLCRSCYTDLDMNCHVNNTKYANFALSSFGDTLSRDACIFGFRIDYTKEVREGEILRIHHQRQENADGTFDVVCRGETDGTPVKFGVRFTIKD